MMKFKFAILFALFLCLSATAAPKDTYRLSSGATLQVEKLAPGIFRVRVSATGAFPQSLMERYGILKTDWEEFSGDGASLRFDPASETLTLKDASGRVLFDGLSVLQAGNELNAQLRDSIQVQYGSIKTRRIGPIIGDNDGTLSEMDLTEGGDPLKSHVIRIPIKDDERFYGGGNTSREHIQHRGERLRMWATYQRTEIPMPFMMSSAGWAVYNNSTRKSYFDIGRLEKDAFSIYTTEPDADFFLFAGEDMPALLNAYTLLTGRNYILPKWAYGLCFGPNMKEDQWDILSDALRFRDAAVPCDVFWLEPQWMSKHYDFSATKKWNYDKFTPEYPWEEKKFPKYYHPSLFIGKIRTFGKHLGLWVCEEYDLSIVEEDALPGAVQTGREHWMDHLGTFIDLGVEGFKLDPARTLDEHTFREYHNGHSDKEMHNLNQVLLPKQMNLMYRSHTGKRGWYHYCGGWTGTQHWGASTSGDNGGGKTALFDQLNLGNSGFMNTSCDVMQVDAEEEMQSLHFGVFLPWMQINSWAGMMHPYYRSAEDQETYRKSIRLRYDLLPYIYSMAIEGALTGMPMVRSMPLAFPDDRAVDDMWTQYMFGPSLCVGIFNDEIYLPEGEWKTDPWAGEKVFIRGGAIIPTAPSYDRIPNEPYSKLTVRVYPHGESSYTMYDCDAESYGYEQGRVAAIRFDCSTSGKTVKFTVNPVEGSFENMPSEREWDFKFMLSRKPSRVLVDGKKVKGWTWKDGMLDIATGSHDSLSKLTIEIQ